MTAASSVTSKPIISADSHVIEPPELFARMDKKYKDTAPHLEKDPERGELYVIEGMPKVAIGVLGSAGKNAQEEGEAQRFSLFKDLPRAGWDPKARAEIQDRDGIAAEVLYPSIGMVLQNHPDLDYKVACFDAYNDWMQEFCAENPARLKGVGLSAVRTPDEGIRDLRNIKKRGLISAALPEFPVVDDYYSTTYDEFWAAAVELELPISFHVFIGTKPKARGSMVGFLINIMRANQDILTSMVLGGVFERHPKLKVVCVEADAGWLPHFMYRMDHMYNRLRFRYEKEGSALAKNPSDYFKENVYLTFQDDFAALKMLELCNPQRLLWANDFPHGDSTWPNSQSLLSQHTKHMTAQQKDWLLHDNVAELYKLN